LRLIHTISLAFHHSWRIFGLRSASDAGKLKLSHWWRIVSTVAFAFLVWAWRQHQSRLLWWLRRRG
jgi:hypothetical protein